MYGEELLRKVKEGWGTLTSVKSAFFSALALAFIAGCGAVYWWSSDTIGSANQRATTAEQDRDLARNCRINGATQPPCPIVTKYENHRVEWRTIEKTVFVPASTQATPRRPVKTVASKLYIDPATGLRGEPCPPGTAVCLHGGAHNSVDGVDPTNRTYGVYESGEEGSKVKNVGEPQH
jgi:hypothetical protein